MSKLPEMIAEVTKFDIDDVSALAAALESNAYARERMTGAPRFPDRFKLLEYASSRVTLQGLLMEFGVNDGSTLRHIADKFPYLPVYGFDSFEGLPEAWADAPAGTFAQKRLPSVPPNVELVVGWFDRTVAAFMDSHKDEKVSLLHIDCDLYSSTQTVLMQLRGNISSGTVIVFDEYFNYPDWRKHEFRAFKEFIGFTGLQYEYIGIVPRFEHVAVRIL